jgi:hypothetical protein
MAYQAALLLVHRPFLNEERGSLTLNHALRSVTSAACEISRLIRACSKHTAFDDALPQVVDYILCAAVIHLLNATSERETAERTTLGKQSANGLRVCLQALLKMESKWKIRAQRSIRRIQELAEKWKVLWALPISLSQPLSHRQNMDARQDLSADHDSNIDGYSDDSILFWDSFDFPEDADYLDEMVSWDVDQYHEAFEPFRNPVETSTFLFDSVDRHG